MKALYLTTTGGGKLPERSLADRIIYGRETIAVNHATDCSYKYVVALGSTLGNDPFKCHFTPLLIKCR